MVLDRDSESYKRLSEAGKLRLEEEERKAEAKRISDAKTEEERKQREREAAEAEDVRTKEAKRVAAERAAQSEADRQAEAERQERLRLRAEQQARDTAERLAAEDADRARIEALQKQEAKTAEEKAAREALERQKAEIAAKTGTTVAGEQVKAIQAEREAEAARKAREEANLKAQRELEAELRTEADIAKLGDQTSKAMTKDEQSATQEKLDKEFERQEAERKAGEERKARVAVRETTARAQEEENSRQMEAELRDAERQGGPISQERQREIQDALSREFDRQDYLRSEQERQQVSKPDSKLDLTPAAQSESDISDRRRQSILLSRSRGEITADEAKAALAALQLSSPNLSSKLALTDLGEEIFTDPLGFVNKIRTETRLTDEARVAQEKGGLEFDKFVAKAAIKGAKDVGVGLIPFVGTYVYWNKMNRPMQAASLLLDAVSLVPASKLVTPKLRTAIQGSAVIKAGEAAKALPGLDVLGGAAREGGLIQAGPGVGGSGIAFHRLEDEIVGNAVRRIEAFDPKAAAAVDGVHQAQVRYATADGKLEQLLDDAARLTGKPATQTNVGDVLALLRNPEPTLARRIEAAIVELRDSEAALSGKASDFADLLQKGETPLTRNLDEPTLRAVEGLPDRIVNDTVRAVQGRFDFNPRLDGIAKDLERRRAFVKSLTTPDGNVTGTTGTAARAANETLDSLTKLNRASDTQATVLDNRVVRMLEIAGRSDLDEAGVARLQSRLETIRNEAVGLRAGNFDQSVRTIRDVQEVVNRFPSDTAMWTPQMRQVAGKLDALKSDIGRRLREETQAFRFGGGGGGDGGWNPGRAPDISGGYADKFRGQQFDAGGTATPQAPARGSVGETPSTPTGPTASIGSAGPGVTVGTAVAGAAARMAGIQSDGAVGVDEPSSITMQPGDSEKDGGNDDGDKVGQVPEVGKVVIPGDDTESGKQPDDATQIRDDTAGDTSKTTTTDTEDDTGKKDDTGEDRLTGDTDEGGDIEAKLIDHDPTGPNYDEPPAPSFVQTIFDETTIPVGGGVVYDPAPASDPLPQASIPAGVGGGCGPGYQPLLRMNANGSAWLVVACVPVQPQTTILTKVDEPPAPVTVPDPTPVRPPEPEPEGDTGLNPKVIITPGPETETPTPPKQDPDKFKTPTPTRAPDATGKPPRPRPRVRFELPSGEQIELPEGKWPRVLSVQQGSNEQFLDIDTGRQWFEYRPERSGMTPFQTLRVVSYDDTPPTTQDWELGFVRFRISPTAIKYQQIREKAQRQKQPTVRVPRQRIRR